MINNKYVPDWHSSPFDHVEYTLARNQVHMDILFADMGDVDEFMSMGADAQVNFYNDSTLAIVQLGDIERTIIQVHSLLLHEAVHIWQRIKLRMGESDPSKEFEAYSIQRIAQDLFAMYEESESD
ncbi:MULTISPECIES: hypothetical protein [Acinetobacter]|uniref:hypothetical protein n=1 Tax=Acinetobacter TaxID=469 RepID=UPI0002AE9213|nr:MULTISPECIES: hypothetical protein [Acinetobacter]ELW84528.1 hypothetical protein ACINWC743_A0847 [Acinetobacter sp. WC-743]MBJ8426625.1 hypothetical protein [Acinetobacter bereziniae]MBJ8476128.1 hypothetical protein [Acinetobacter bereziniae]MCU4599074.1 hypothetical protein [Acinetobacter bereziniae]